MLGKPLYKMNIVQKLSLLFERFPGIGPRQARRFVYALLDENNDTVKELASAIQELKSAVKRCRECFRAFEESDDTCSSCNTNAKNPNMLVVEKDVDLENIEKAGIYNGLFHILGGSISPLNPNSQEKLHLKKLFDRIKKSPEINEVILATSATIEGDATSAYIENILEEFKKQRGLKISRLGRGLSTGSHLEFSDRDTLRNAMDNRK